LLNLNNPLPNKKFRRIWWNHYRLTSDTVYEGLARLAQSAERKTLNLVVVGSSPTLGATSVVRATLGMLTYPSLALLAQLVARGSDKAKVIGSSPVESNE
jgi:ketopantoate hydroxymethyltransferase